MNRKKADLIFALLQGDDEFLFKCINILWDKQTSHEKATVSTMYHNFVGFSKADGAILGTYADRITRKDKLSIGEINDARERMGKYAKQLCNYINYNEL